MAPWKAQGIEKKGTSTIASSFPRPRTAKLSYLLQTMHIVLLKQTIFGPALSLNRDKHDTSWLAAIFFNDHTMIQRKCTFNFFPLANHICTLFLFVKASILSPHAHLNCTLSTHSSSRGHSSHILHKLKSHAIAPSALLFFMCHLPLPIAIYHSLLYIFLIHLT